MTKNLILAALLATSASLSFAQAPAKAVVPAGATPTVAVATTAEAKPAAAPAKKVSKKKSTKKAAKSTATAK